MRPQYLRLPCENEALCDVTEGTETSLAPAPSPWDHAILGPALSDVFVPFQTRGKCNKASAVL